ncbi:MAG: hypothetical protein HETSPECPRED_008650 [Heterodermia speciosa]|uniref:Uncharacterized protein n=1 Tax=Heterodermia speciosa TaxID=116794 RepID=A0A8H3G298_9LECA|nr:MAG: hypothetical protein HETSPECPRED_008650 [Heterodermia speciosa]
MKVVAAESHLLKLTTNGGPSDSLKADSLVVPVKRNADSDDHSLSEQKPKRCRKNKGPDPSEREATKDPDEKLVGDSQNTLRGELAYPKAVADLKELLEDLIRRQDIESDADGLDLQRKFCVLKLKEYLRHQGSDGEKKDSKGEVKYRWACPAPNCSRSYSRKSHMRSHVVKSSGTDHQIPREAMSKVECCHCRDQAHDEMIMKKLKIVMEGRKEKPPPSSPATGSKVQEGYGRETIAEEEQAIMTPKSRQRAHISRIVEHLSKSTQSDTEEGSRSGHETDTHDSADLLHKSGDRKKQLCSESISSLGSDVPNTGRGRSFSPVVVSEGAHSMAPDIPRDCGNSTGSDGETAVDSESPIMQSRDRRGASTQHQPTTKLDFYHTRSPAIMQRRQFATKAWRIPGNDTPVPPHLSKPGSENEQHFSRLYQPHFDPGHQVDRSNAKDLSCPDWELVSYSGYRPSEHHQYWASAGASPFLNQSLGLTRDGTIQGHPYDSIGVPVYSHQWLQPDGRQPLYQLPEQALSLGADYYSTNAYEVPHQQIQNCFHDGLFHQNKHSEQQNNSCEQNPSGSEIYTEQNPSFDEPCANKCDGWYERKPILVARPETVV